MGVRGLQTFLKKNEEYLTEKIKVHDTHLVVDANNLLCSLYTDFTTDRKDPDYRNDIYGGNLVRYGQVVREFFENLKKCNITVVLVFDGSVIGKHALRDFVASKEKETMRRGLDKFNRAKKIEESSTGDDILLPQNLNLVFKNVAAEFVLQKIQTPYEADTHIARVANQLECPVLTNDSDFLIYSLKKGFILLDQLRHKNPRVAQKGKWYIEATLFKQSKFSKALPGLKIEVLPLLSILLGNDYVEASAFDKIMVNICNVPYRGPFNTESYSHRRIGNMLTWLQGKSLREAIDHVLELVHPSHRTKLNRVIELLLRNYRIETEDDFEKELEAIFPSDKVLSKDQETPVKFLKKQMEQSDLNSMALDMIFRNTHYNYSIIDDFSLPSSSYVKFKPYSLALALLRPESGKDLTIYRRRLQVEKDAFFIYDRVRDEYTKLRVMPMESLENFGSVEHLDCYSMIALDHNLRRSILMNCFRFNQDEQTLMSATVSQLFSGEYTKQATSCFLLVKYVGLETKIAPKHQFVSALTLALFYYAAQSGSLNYELFPHEDSYKHLILRLEALSITSNRSDEKTDRSIFRRIVHFIAQLQAAYKAYSLVNSLLNHPCHPPRQELFFNSTLIYRVTRLLRLDEENVDSFCDGLNLLSDVCDSIRVQVHC